MNNILKLGYDHQGIFNAETGKHLTDEEVEELIRSLKLEDFQKGKKEIGTLYKKETIK